jgi:hypothetical protein
MGIWLKAQARRLRQIMSGIKKYLQKVVIDNLKP